MPAERRAERGRALYCTEAAPVLPSMVDGSGPVPPEVWAHVRTCLGCQAELARYRRLLRSLRALHHERVLPAPGSLRGTLEALQAAPAARSLRRAVTAAYVGGVVMATAASAAGMLIWVSRRRVAFVP